MMSSGKLAQILIIFESETACRQRLIEQGFAPDAAAEVARYLSQGTDLVAYYSRLQSVFEPLQIRVDFYEIGEHKRYLPLLQARPAQTLIWTMTDGFRYYRGSYVSALAAVLGVKTFGSGAQAQMICQDKFKSTMLIGAAGGRVPASTLARNDELLGPRLEPDPGQALFVKPNTLGAKLGIVPGSKCYSLAEALAQSRRIWQRYRDAAIIQTYIPGYDVRVSFMDAARHEDGSRPGIYRLGGVAQGETGGEFMTMGDTDTLLVSRAGSETPLNLPPGQPLAFRPEMIDLTRQPALAGVVSDIEMQTAAVARLLDLRDYYSVDIRVSDTAEVYVLEFEVCPAVTIYDFQTYLADAYGLDLSGALQRSLPRAFARRESHDLEG
jgi:D-alanine-D-alanine ligase